MIIACPACKTRYAVPENAIGDDGRTVRCAKCKHSWFQEPVFDLPPLEEDTSQTAEAEAAPTPTPASPPSQPAPEPEPVAEAEPEPEAEQTESAPSINHWRTGDRPAGPTDAVSTGATSAAAALGQDRAEPEAEVEQEPSEAIADSADDAGFDQDSNADLGPAAPYGEADYADGDASDDYSDGDYDEDEASQFDYRPPFTARRNPLKMWTAAAAIFAMLATGTIVAVNYYGMPDWAPFNRPVYGIGKSELELDFPQAQQRTETLPSGTEIFRARGTITNTGRETMDVPQLRIVLRDERERIVFDWNVAPPRSQLAPGETMTVTEAITDVPRSARFAEIGWSPN